ncbi:hypothetical protein HID58_070315 [Brassica napus]|uniref:Uncharacterized protein n=1 Tax=Brassica napus TaxID=3708 RepID=A0ABQ7YYG4_BRANA|nr:hypothetical protein HID58_070315 [Brassica napus]
MFSVLIGAFTMRVRFVTVFMYLDLSQRSLSDNDYNEMVVVVYGEISRVRRRKLHLGLLSDLKRFPLTMPFSLARKVGLMKKLTNFQRLNCFVLFLNLKMVDHDYVEYNNSSITSSLSMALCLTSFPLYKSGARSLTSEEARRHAVGMRIVLWKVKNTWHQIFKTLVLHYYHLGGHGDDSEDLALVMV